MVDGQSFPLSARADRMADALREAFTVRDLTITDDSARHAGHAGAAPGGETHFIVQIISEDFAGMSRIARHRAVHACLAAEFDSGLHALMITARTPHEA